MSTSRIGVRAKPASSGCEGSSGTSTGSGRTPYSSARTVGSVGAPTKGLPRAGRYAAGVPTETETPVIAPVIAPVITPTEEPGTRPVDTDGGDHDRFAHYCKKADITRALRDG